MVDKEGREPRRSDLHSGRGTSLRSPFLTTPKAAEYLVLAAKTLENLRVLGGGPRFRKHGRRVVYRVEDLDAWSEENLRTSTSDPGPSV